MLCDEERPKERGEERREREGREGGREKGERAISHEVVIISREVSERERESRVSRSH